MMLIKNCARNEGEIDMIIKQELDAYIEWCKSQGTGLKPSEYSVFEFYMKNVYPFKDKLIQC